MNSFFIDACVREIKLDLTKLLNEFESSSKIYNIANKKSFKKEILEKLERNFNFVKDNYLESWDIPKGEYEDKKD